MTNETNNCSNEAHAGTFQEVLNAHAKMVSVEMASFVKISLCFTYNPVGAGDVAVGGIVGGAVAAVVILVIVLTFCVLLVVFLRRIRKRKSKEIQLELVHLIYRVEAGRQLVLIMVKALIMSALFLPLHTQHPPSATNACSSPEKINIDQKSEFWHNTFFVLAYFSVAVFDLKEKFTVWSSFSLKVPKALNIPSSNIQLGKILGQGNGKV